MLDTLKNHPFAVETFFKSSLVLTYAVPASALQQFIPPCLTLDTFDTSWAFLAVAMVDTKGLRPKGFPAFTGSDFILTGYRIFVRYTTPEGKRLRGLYILRSETNRSKMALLGNIFTHYNYQTTDINFTSQGTQLAVQSARSGLNVLVDTATPDVPLPSSSPFRDWKEARRYAGPLPFTFTFNEKSNEVLIIEGVRENWTPTPVEVLQHDVGFIKNLNMKNVVLANAFIIRNIPYYWKKGRIDHWKHETEAISGSK